MAQAQLYPYFADTMQWDSAAGDIIVQTAGGRVEDLEGNDYITAITTKKDRES